MRGGRIADVETSRVRTNTGRVLCVERITFEDGRSITFKIHECPYGYAVSARVWPAAVQPRAPRALNARQLVRRQRRRKSVRSGERS